MKYEKIHACRNDCCLFRKELSDANVCPSCGMSRWNIPKNSKKEVKNVPVKVMWYFSPIPRFERMFRSKETSKLLTWHGRKREVNDLLQHPKDALSWKKINNLWPEFGSEPRNLRLALSTDGINPHGDLSSRYSCWPVMLVTYNLPPWLFKGYHACPICGEKTSSIYLPKGRKMAYIGHRKFLPRHHPYRKQKKVFNGAQELELAPEPLSGEEIFIQTNVVHIEKDVCATLIGTLLDILGKTKDGVKSRLDLVELNIRSELAPQVGEKKIFLPPTCYTLSRAEKLSYCKTLSELKVLEGYSSNIQSLVSLKDLKLYGLKSHDHHVLMQQLLPVIRGILPKHVRLAIIQLCFFFNAICKKTIDTSQLKGMQEDVVVTLCLLEKYFPPSFFSIMVHLVVHIVREIEFCGPVHLRWMYPFERYMKVLKTYVRNRNRPEGCMVENYIVEEAIEFYSKFIAGVSSIGLNSSVIKKNSNMDRALSASSFIRPNKEQLDEAHLYVIQNVNDVLPYVEQHMESLRKLNSGKARSKKWIQEEHNRSFSRWLSTRVALALEVPKTSITPSLRWIAHGPSPDVATYYGYIINGYYYHTKRMPNVDTPNETDDTNSTYIRDDCEGRWVEKVRNITAIFMIHKWRIIVRMKEKCFQKQKLSIQFNEHGQPVGATSKKMQSYIGVCVRQQIPITYNSWKEVPNELKDKIYDCISMSFDLQPNAKHSILMSASRNFRTFKTTLTQKYILPSKDQPSLLQFPSKIYSHINQEDWESFVDARLSEEWEDYSRIQRERRSKCVYNHHMSRKGYANLADELDELVATNKNEDILTDALGSKEHGGRVRGVGGFVSQSQYFNTVKGKEKMCHKEEDDSRCKSDKKRSNHSRSSIGSINIDLDADEDTPTNKGVEGTPCQLSIGSINNIVVVATIVEDNSRCPNVKVLVDVVTGENLTILNPVKGKIETLNQALGLKTWQAKHDLQRYRSTPKWRPVKCPRQLDSIGYGYYVQKYIHEIVHNSSTSITSLFNTKNGYRQEEIDEIRTEWANFVSRYV
ncbi:transposase [Cucumis melo var. makuwa]|uniref:Transposase n=1 Tax=Cucumis melo var. makuwa TaxID=1194695 RepID=A0A5A7URB3_CUCMM|nr:transposase [Cucumis melo var. makuwa]